MGRGSSKAGGGSGGGGAKSISTKSLPKLEGSEKQVAWAESIRDKYIADINRIIADGEFESSDLENYYYRGTGAMYGRMKDDTGEHHSTPYDRQLRKITAANPNMSSREQISKAEDYRQELITKAKGKRKAAWDKARAQGKRGEERKKIARKAESDVYATEIIKWVKADLQVSTKASSWIDQFKGTKYSRR